MSTYLPQEIVEEIVVKLPIKSRFRLLTVSKEWRKLITAILNIPTNKTTFLLLCSSTRTQFAFNLDNYGIFQDYTRLMVEDDREQTLSITASGYGLIVFEYVEQVILWNPFIRRAFILPELGEESRLSEYTISFGVVVDYMNNECKVLRMDVHSTVAIFRLSTRSWELLVLNAPFFLLFGCQVDLKGICYWIGEDDHRKMLLVSFDGCTELFTSIELPLPPLSNNKIFGVPVDYLNQLLFLFDESLIYIHAENYVGDDEGYVIRCNIWKMEDSEGEVWVLYQAICFQEHVIPLGFRENGEFVWAGCKTKKLISINLKNGEFTPLGTHDADHLLSCPNYVESVALLDATRGE
ncbi:hypothetical protein LIER_28101 [Lithospermum erythrorhizon]|uniref:F-box domain-containing protein n=1 Tax=Lithospermum erythrorhizon TaxID=34254 RepID=A0AAV3REE3_LITER